MTEKAVIVGLILVLIVGVIAVVGLVNSFTGYLIEDVRHVCKCVIEQFDYYGNPTGIETHELKTQRTFLSTHTQQCTEACNNNYRISDADTLVSGKIEPVKYLRRRKPYHEPRVLRSRI